MELDEKIKLGNGQVLTDSLIIRQSTNLEHIVVVTVTLCAFEVVVLKIFGAV